MSGEKRLFSISRWWVGLILAACASGSLEAQEGLGSDGNGPAPDCTPVLRLPDRVTITGYDPFRAGPLVQDVGLRATGASCAAGRTVLVSLPFRSGELSLAGPSGSLRAEALISGLDIARPVLASGADPDRASGAPVLLPEQDTGVVSEPLRLRLPPGQIVPPGRYLLSVPADPVRGEGLVSALAGSQAIAAAPVELEVVVDAVVRVGLAGCSGGASGAAGTGLDGAGLAAGVALQSYCAVMLGEPGTGMRTGDVRHVPVTALANVAFRLGLRSDNAGALVLEGSGATARASQRVAYGVALDGAGGRHVFDCQSGDCGTSDPLPPSSSLAGTALSLRLEVTDPDVRSRRAGTYIDTLTLTIQPLP